MSSHSHHVRVVCTYCHTVMQQCRCIEPKQTRFSVCDSQGCRDLRNLEATDIRGEVKRLRAENERLRAVVEAAKCIRHWHDREPDGMVVSAEHVRLLWVALAALDQERK